MKHRPEPPEASDDAELFRQAVTGVTPLAPDNRVVKRPPPRKPRPSGRDTPAAQPAVRDYLSDHGAGECALTEFLRPGLSRMALRKLRRGQLPIEGSLDLHGNIIESARRLLLEFLDQASQHHLRCVRIVHGKGRSPDGSEGLLKIYTRHWLTQCPQVLAFCEPPPRDGGGGAVLVLLKSGG